MQIPIPNHCPNRPLCLLFFYQIVFLIVVQDHFFGTCRFTFIVPGNFWCAYLCITAIQFVLSYILQTIIVEKWITFFANWGHYEQNVPSEWNGKGILLRKTNSMKSARLYIGRLLNWRVVFRAQWESSSWSLWVLVRSLWGEISSGAFRWDLVLCWRCLVLGALVLGAWWGELGQCYNLPRAV